MTFARDARVGERWREHGTGGGPQSALADISQPSGAQTDVRG